MRPAKGRSSSRNEGRNNKMRIFKAVREQIATRSVRSRQEMSFLPYQGYVAIHMHVYTSTIHYGRILN